MSEHMSPDAVMDRPALPCPFCGGDPCNKFCNGWGWIECVSCGAKGPAERIGHGGNPDGAWNKRRKYQAGDQLPGGLRVVREEPIPMILHCPACNRQHIDQAQDDWDNPPHKSHLCAYCNCIWRPADVSTTGVEKIRTHGKADNWPLDASGED